MPLRLPSLNLAGVGLPRLGIGSSVRPRNPVVRPGTTPSPDSRMPQTPPTPTLYDGSDITSSVDSLAQDSTRSSRAEESTEMTTPHNGIARNADGSINWMSILAPALGAGAAAIAGGGAMNALKMGLSGVGGMAKGTLEGQAIRRKKEQTDRELGIKGTEAASRKTTAENMDTDRQDRLHEAKIRNAVKTRVIPTDVTPEEAAQIKASIEDEEEKKAVGEIEAAKTPDALDGIKVRIQGNEWLSGKTQAGLISRAESNKTGLSTKLEREVSKEDFDKETRTQQLEINRLTAEGAKEQRNVIAAQKTQDMLKHAVELNDWDTFILVKPAATRAQFDALRDDRLREKALEWDYRNPKKDEKTGGSIPRTQEELDALARSLGAGRSSAAAGVDEAKISEYVNALLKYPESERKAKLDQADLSPSEKAAVLKRLPFGGKGEVLDTTRKQQAIGELGF